MRWGSATTYFRRTASQDFEYLGKQVKEGQKVIYWWASGNRDERVIDDPFRVNLQRSPNRHMSFGQAGRTSALACGWHDWKCGCCSKSLPNGSSRLNLQASKSS
jgi:cytochrome P450